MEDLGSIPAPHKLGMVELTCNPSTWEGDVKGLGVQGHPWPHKGLEVSLGYVRDCLNEVIEILERIAQVST